jgi:hypothetical protein
LGAWDVLGAPVEPSFVAETMATVGFPPWEATAAGPPRAGATADARLMAPAALLVAEGAPRPAARLPWQPVTLKIATSKGSAFD